MPKYSIIVPEKDNWNYLQMFLLSLNLHTKPDNIEVIIVDHSERGTKVKVSSDKIKHIKMPNDEGIKYSQACIRGATEATGEWLIFMNDDVVLTPGWLDKTEKWLDILEGKRLGLLAYSGLNFGGPSHLQMPHFLHYPFPLKFPRVTSVGLIKRETYFEVGGFNTNMPSNNYSDDDLCVRLLKAGYDNYVLPINIFHFGSRTFRSPELFDKDMEAGHDFMIMQYGHDWEKKYYSQAYP